MTVPDHSAAAEPRRADAPTSSLLRAAIWVAIGALIAAAIVCVVWVLLGEQNDIVGRAFLTILLLAAFAGVAILDAHLAARRPAWFALASMVSWVVTLLIGAVMIWMPERYSWGGFSRFIQFLLIVLILQLALLHIRLYVKAFQRYVTAFTQAVAIITIALVIALAALLVVPLIVSEYVRLRRHLLAHRGRHRHPRRRRHGADAARQRAVRAQAAAPGRSRSGAVLGRSRADRAAARPALRRAV